MKKLIIITLVVLLSSSIFSMEEKRGLGISFNSGNPVLNLMTSSQVDFDADALITPLHPSVYYIHKINKWNIEPAIAYVSVPNGDNRASLTTVSIGFLNHNNSAGYWGNRFSLTSTTDMEDLLPLLDFVLGREYNFSDKFSIGGEVRLNMRLIEIGINNISSHLFFRFYK